MSPILLYIITMKNGVFTGLNRDDLIMIAMLVGSDYTSGLAGVGPVNAIEIVAHFPRSQSSSTPQSRLRKFIDAYLSSQMNQQLLKKLKSIEFTDGKIFQSLEFTIFRYRQTYFINLKIIIICRFPK